MTRLTALLAALLIVFSFNSICNSQTDHISISPPTLQLYGVPDADGNLKIEYAVVTYLITNRTGTTKKMVFNLSSSQGWFSEEDSIWLSYEHWDNNLENYISPGSDTLSFRSCDLANPSGIDTLIFKFYPEIHPTDVHQLTSIVAYDNNTEIASKDINRMILDQQYPIPFGGTTQIPFYLPYAGEIIIIAWDVRGEFVDTLLSARKHYGYHLIRPHFSSYPSGVYFIRAEFEAQSITRKYTIVR